eukprot:TRINITY_DN9860_c0_g1_i1.p2 TRINITY_DN9860_c0_g1~~TRINITY_DN9860_c0_g1_i1.p2  ORF type:complete len:107 (+),score=30.00 TRINITY_DN9860_c0_g1_i1:691-1011(+)
MGKAVVMVLEDPEKYKGEWIPVVGEIKTIGEMLKDFTEVTGIPAKHVSIPTETFKQFGFPGADELASMFDYFQAHGVFGPHDVKKSPSDCISFATYLKQTGWKGEK